MRLPDYWETPITTRLFNAINPQFASNEYTFTVRLWLLLPAMALVIPLSLLEWGLMEIRSRIGVKGERDGNNQQVIW